MAAATAVAGQGQVSLCRFRPKLDEKRRVQVVQWNGRVWVDTCSLNIPPLAQLGFPRAHLAGRTCTSGRTHTHLTRQKYENALFRHLGYLSGLWTKKGQGSRERCDLDAGIVDVVEVADDAGDVGDVGGFGDVGDVGDTRDSRNAGDVGIGDTGNGSVSGTNVAAGGFQGMEPSGGVSSTKLSLSLSKGGGG